MWERIEQVVPRHEPAAAIAALFELALPLDSDADEAWRTQLVTRFGTVRPFLKLLVTVVDFGATPEGLPVLTALKSLPDLMGRKKVGPAEVDTGLLTGSWRRLALSTPHLEPGTVAGRRTRSACWSSCAPDAAEQAGVREELLQASRTPPAAGSTSPGSNATGRTSSGSSAPSTLAPCARTT